MKGRRLIFSLIALFVTGCAHTEVWEKAGGNQHAFDLDSRECGIIAQQIALEGSATGKTADPVFYGSTYVQCLNAKGWRRKAAAAEPEKVDAAAAIPRATGAISPNTVKGFGQTITVPEGYTLVADKQLQGDAAIIEQYLWKGPDSSFINILFQKNTAAAFEQIPYPVPEPYRLYASGQGKTARERLPWAVFFGQIGSEWVMGTGAYYYAGDKERIIISITGPLARPEGTPPENLTLTRNQFARMEEFSGQWLPWLNQQFTEGPGPLRRFIRTLHLGM